MTDRPGAWAPIRELRLRNYAITVVVGVVAALSGHLLAAAVYAVAVLAVFAVAGGNPLVRWHAPFVGAVVLLWLYGATGTAVLVGACTLISATLMAVGMAGGRREDAFIAAHRPAARVWTSVRTDADGAATLGIGPKVARSCLLVVDDRGLELLAGRERRSVLLLPWEDVEGARATTVEVTATTSKNGLDLLLAGERTVQLTSYVMGDWPERVILARPADKPWPVG